jgi:hypothetical protein
MRFKPSIWYPIGAAVLSALNLVAVGAAARSGESWHAGIHAALALAFGLAAQRLWQWAARARGAAISGDTGEIQARLEAVELEQNRMRQELSEAQERLDFAERMLVQGQEQRRMNPPE